MLRLKTAGPAFQNVRTADARPDQRVRESLEQSVAHFRGVYASQTYRYRAILQQLLVLWNRIQQADEVWPWAVVQPESICIAYAGNIAADLAPLQRTWGDELG